MKLTTAIVDDDKIFHFLMEILLKEAAISNAPIGLHGGPQFLEWWQDRQSASEASLVFLDLNMPLVDGWKVLEKLHEQGAKNTFVVIITSSIDPKDRKRAESYPMVIDFLVKPILLENLTAIRQSPFLKEHF
ncbi:MULTISPECIES: response regulator [Sphingobacterium]|uniref:response regulator n=1 Tax=Sphingobacterium TaxID=28453 RepID=UPI0013DC70D4|nr:MULTISPECIES: response regulator [unclassified Sphingobacterium]